MTMTIIGMRDERLHNQRFHRRNRAPNATKNASAVATPKNSGPPHPPATPPHHPFVRSRRAPARGSSVQGPHWVVGNLPHPSARQKNHSGPLAPLPTRLLLRGNGAHASVVNAASSTWNAPSKGRPKQWPPAQAVDVASTVRSKARKLNPNQLPNQLPSGPAVHEASSGESNPWKWSPKKRPNTDKITPIGRVKGVELNPTGRVKGEEQALGPGAGGEDGGDGGEKGEEGEEEEEEEEEDAPAKNAASDDDRPRESRSVVLKGFHARLRAVFEEKRQGSGSLFLVWSGRNLVVPLSCFRGLRLAR